MKIKTDKEIEIFNTQFNRLSQVNTMEGRNKISIGKTRDNNLVKVIKQDKTYSQTLSQMASAMSDGYNTLNNRQSSITINGVKYPYLKEKSSDDWAHYENNDTIIITIHGVKNMEQLLIGARRFLKPKNVSNLFKSFMNKYNEVKDTRKQLILIGHSLGTQMISFAVKSLGGNPLALLIAPYIPKRRDPYSVFIANNPNFKKILFDSDWIGNKIMNMRPVNTLIYVNFDTTKLRIISGHPVSKFIKNPPSVLKSKQSRFSKLILGLRGAK